MEDRHRPSTGSQQRKAGSARDHSSADLAGRRLELRRVTNEPDARNSLQGPCADEDRSLDAKTKARPVEIPCARRGVPLPERALTWLTKSRRRNSGRGHGPRPEG